MAHTAYVHIPFCSFKCDFCDFAAYAGLDHLTEAYCSVVCREIAERLSGQRPSLGAVYYGGGTPGLIEPCHLNMIHSAFKRFAHILPGAEISLETTPQAITLDKAARWREIGINRLSIGVQSFCDEELKRIGRDHTATEALTGIETAKTAGFENLSLDLMYNLPEQTLKSWDKSLSTALSLDLPHLSAYALTIEINAPLLTRYPRSASAWPAENAIQSMYEILVNSAESKGLLQYEISNFARPGLESIHNLAYWSNEEYFAFGVSAHRYVSSVRSANWRSLKRYMSDPLGLELNEPVDEPTRVKEAIFLALRTRRGIVFSTFKERYGVDLKDKFHKTIERMKEGGFVEPWDDRLALSQKGMLVSNLVMAEFI